MDIFSSWVNFLREYLLYNPLAWGIAAVVLWIVGSAFFKALREKDGEDT